MIASGVFSSWAAAARASRQAVQWFSSARSSIAGLALADLTERIGVGSILFPSMPATSSRLGVPAQSCAFLGVPFETTNLTDWPDRISGDKSKMCISVHIKGELAS